MQALVGEWEEGSMEINNNDYVSKNFTIKNMKTGPRIALDASKKGAKTLIGYKSQLSEFSNPNRDSDQEIFNELSNPNAYFYDYSEIMNSNEASLNSSQNRYVSQQSQQQQFSSTSPSGRRHGANGTNVSGGDNGSFQRSSGPWSSPKYGNQTGSPQGTLYATAEPSSNPFRSAKSPSRTVGPSGAGGIHASAQGGAGASGGGPAGFKSNSRET
eukprot:TRINITY_DN12284_c0_g1_i1.p1 TRINITY_DN12284_c0_g1~~TRINITY_DN12284_c0_g1_i1.p1  ORF type:complete len:214 (-),score=41.94 TRINITY_DN12284_c0_g1_i1:312-953(-)